MCEFCRKMASGFPIRLLMAQCCGRCFCRTHTKFSLPTLGNLTLCPMPLNWNSKWEKYHWTICILFCVRDNAPEQKVIPIDTNACVFLFWNCENDTHFMGIQIFKKFQDFQREFFCRQLNTWFIQNSSYFATYIASQNHSTHKRILNK